MGPLLVLVCPCFRENVIVTCKIVSFLCSLDNFLLKNVIVFVFGNQISRWRSFEKKRSYFLTYFSHFLITREKTQKFFQQYLTYTYFAQNDFFLPCQFCKNYEFIKYGFSLVRLLVLILICAILEQSINNKMVSKSWNVYYWYLFTQSKIYSHL